MKILHVNHLLDPLSGGGTAERTFQISRELALLGGDCTILTLDIGAATSRAAGIPRLRIEALPCLQARFFVPKVSTSQIDSWVADADVVQMFGNWTILNLLVWRACRRLGRPFVFCPAGALPAFGRSLLFKRAYTLLVSRGLVRDAARGICITHDERAHFLELGAQASRLETIPNGIDPGQYTLAEPAREIAQFRTGLGIGSAPFILYLGRLNPIKGPDLLLDAFIELAAKWPQHHLVFGGLDGGLLSQLTQLARAKGLAERVHFPGFLQGSTKSAALREAQLLAIPSRSEAMSIVVLEAGACSCPALFTDACGLEIFQARGAGTMVAVDAQAIAVTLDRLLAQPAALTSQGERLRDIVMSEFLWSGQAARYLALYEQIVQQYARAIHAPG